VTKGVKGISQDRPPSLEWRHRRTEKKSNKVSGRTEVALGLRGGREKQRDLPVSTGHCVWQRIARRGNLGRLDRKKMEKAERQGGRESLLVIRRVRIPESMRSPLEEAKKKNTTPRLMAAGSSCRTTDSSPTWWGKVGFPVRRRSRGRESKRSTRARQRRTAPQNEFTKRESDTKVTVGG